MASNPESDKIDEIADGIDDLKTSVEEIEADSLPAVDRHTVRKLKNTLDEASTIADELGDKQDRSER